MRAHISRGLGAIGGNLGSFALTLARNKLLAVFFGPAGIGWIALVNNLNETGAVVSGTGICDAFNRELARKRSQFTAAQIVSTGLGMFILLLALVVPVVIVLFFASTKTNNGLLTGIFGLIIAGVAAGTWRFFSGIYLGFGLSKAMFHVVVGAAAANLVAGGAMLYLGVKEPMAYVATTPVLLAVAGFWGLRYRLKGLIDLAAVRRLPARKPILTIALPIILGLLLEPLTAFYMRSVAAARFGETAVGLLQPGMQFVALSATLFNAFIGMTLVRWDQSDEEAFSFKFKMLILSAIALAVVGVGAVFALRPLWPLLVRLFFTNEFLPGVQTVPWLLAGEAMRMGGAMLNHTFLSRNYGMLTLVPRIACLVTAVAALHAGMATSIVTIAQAYTLAYFSYFSLSVVLWIVVQVRLARMAPSTSGS